jgi:N,N'-diacetyllegionaminate synthase
MKFALSKSDSVYTIAEVGGNHQGSLRRAHSITVQALSTFVDSIKFQYYTADTLVHPGFDPARYQHFKGFELNANEYVKLARIVTDQGKDFALSLWDPSEIDTFKDVVSYWKIGSGDFTNLGLIDRLAATKKPLILSTGLCTWDEIDIVIDHLAHFHSDLLGAGKVCLLQCTSSYPNLEIEVNLDVMSELSRRYRVPVGYSHHTESTFPLELAIMMGASVVEFHYSDNKKDNSFRDHGLSLESKHCVDLAEFIQRCTRVRGSSIKVPTEGELKSGHVDSFRRSIYAAQDIPEGGKFTEDNLVALRPFVPGGLSPLNYLSVLGKTARREFRKDELIRQSDFD